MNKTLDGTGACFVSYTPSTNSLYLFNDSSSATLGPLTPGVAGSVQNSQCVLDAGGSSVTVAGNSVTLNAALTFKAAFAGTGSLHRIAVDAGGLDSGFQNQGTWTTQ